MSAAPAPGPAQHAPERVETERLLLTRPVAQDLDDVAELLADPLVGRWLGGPADRARTAAMLERFQAHWTALGFGLWTARDRATGALVGRGGLSIQLAGGAGGVEAGWTIASGRWGEGLGTELGAAAIAVAERDLGLDELISLTLPDNVASRRVMEKLGFAFDRDIVHRGLPHVLYRRCAGAVAAGPAT